MDERTSDFWAQADQDLLKRWPQGSDGKPEPAEKLAIQWELDAMADITLSMLESCGIPAFKAGTQGRVIFGFAGLGVEIYVPASRLAEAQALLETPVAETDDSSET